MDEFLFEINNLRPVKGDSKSFTHFATTIACYVNDMEDNGCPVVESSEAPFLMSQLLSKLDPKDNSDFGRDMKREGNEETISSPGYIRKLVFALEAKPAPSVREEMKVGERKVPKRQKIMPLTAKKLMTKRVHLTVKQNIIWLPVLSSRI